MHLSKIFVAFRQYLLLASVADGAALLGVLMLSKLLLALTFVTSAVIPPTGGATAELAVIGLACSGPPNCFDTPTAS